MKAMILAAGRGERMRPLSDRLPKPLLEAGGKPLIVWQIERLVAAGFTDIVINHAHLGSMIEDALSDGRRFGARIDYSAEREALETAGGIAQALPLLGDRPFVAVSADVYTDFDYARLVPRIAAVAANPADTVAHVVLTDSPPVNRAGDMGLASGRATRRPPLLNYGNIGVYHPALFRDFAPGEKRGLYPWLFGFVEEGRVSAEHFGGAWFNVGTPQELADLDRALRGG